MRGIGVVATWVVVFVMFLGLGFGLNYAGYLQYSFFAPKYEQVRNDTFKNSQAYNDGMVRELYKIKAQYLAADADGKTALKGYAQHEFSVYDRNRLPPDLQAFYDAINQ